MPKSKKKCDNKVLICTKDSVFFRKLSKILCKQSIQAVLSVSFPRFIKRNDPKVFSASLVDAESGVLDGPEKTELYKIFSGSVPVLFLTGRKNRKKIQDYISAGCFLCLEKDQFSLENVARSVIIATKLSCPQSVVPAGSSGKKDFFGMIIDRIPIPVIVSFAPGFKISQINRHAEILASDKILDINKVKTQDLVRLWPFRFPDGSLCGENYYPHYKAVNSGVWIENELMLIKNNDKEFWVSVSSSGLFDSDGKLIAVMTLFPDITLLKKTELSLLREKAFHTHLIENAPEAVIMTSNEGKVLMINEEFTNLFGYERDEILGKYVDDFIAPSDLREEAVTVTKNIEKGSRISLETVRKRKDGSLINVSIVGAPIVFEGRQEAVYGIYRDITERVKAVSNLKSRIKELNCLFRTAEILLEEEFEESDAVFSKIAREIPGALTFPEHAFSKISIFGKDYYSKPFNDFSHRHSAEIKIKENTVGAVSVFYDEEISPEEQNIFLEEEKAMLKDIASRISSFLVQKKTLEELHESEEKMSLAVDAAEIGLWDWSFQTGKLDVSERWAQMLGYDIKSVKTDIKFLLGIIHPEDKEKVVGLLEKQRSNPEKYFRSDFRLKCASGNWKWVLSCGKIPRDNPHHMVGISIDINEHKRLEEQLMQAQKIEAVGKLAGGVAHDFNNILQAILGYAEFASEMQAASHDCSKELIEIQNASAKAIELTSRLLAFGRRQVLKPVSLDINEKIRDLLIMIRRIIGENNRLEFIPGHKLGSIWADPVQIDQVLLNLCINARDAMPSGGEILIETENVYFDDEYCRTHLWATQGKYVLLSVSDTGIGMDEETSRHAFDPFFTTKEPGKGMGLGLSTVHGIIKQHNAMINLYSETGKGTTFKMYFPIVEQKASEVERILDGPIEGGNERILIAEDDETLRTMLKRMLESVGYTVYAVEDGAQAISHIKENWPRTDLALLDVVMPNMGGKEVYNFIRDNHPHIKIIFSSGYTPNAIHTDFVLHEGFTLVQKPYKREQLLKAIRSVLDKRSDQNPDLKNSVSME